MVSKRHGVAISPIYGWRSDARFQADAPEVGMFAAVEIADPIDADTPSPSRSPPLPVPSIEITLENARKPVVSDGVDAGFILVLARGLAV